MKQSDTGDTVRVHYKGSLLDGTEFDNSAGRDPIEVTIGNGQVIPGFEKALIGMTAGETRTVTIEPDQAYGQHETELVLSVPRDRIPADVALQAGGILQMTDASGDQINLLVVEFDDDTVTLDGNHPLAGKTLAFELQLVEIVP